MERGRLARCGRGRPRSIHAGLFFNWLFGLNQNYEPKLFKKKLKPFAQLEQAFWQISPSLLAKTLKPLFHTL